MDTKRVEKLREWLSEFDGRVGTFCRHYGLDHSRASFLSQVLSGHLSLGEKAARRLEAECNRPHGWLDQTHEMPLPVRLDLARIAELPLEDRELIQDFVTFVIERREKHRFGASKPVVSYSVESVTSPSPAERRKLAEAAERPVTTKTLIANERKGRGQRKAA